MDNLANGHDSEVEAPSAALQEVDLNGVPMTNGSHSTKDRDTEPDGVLDANQDSGDDDHEDREQGEDGVGQAELTTGLAPKKKKKKRKPKSKRGIGKPTGFEEYYVDAPVTPAEYEEEKDMYHQSRTFSERIETAIQRYKAKRNFDSERKDVFDKYMSFGGIDTGPKMFGGLDAKVLDDHNAEEIRKITATNFVGGDKANIGKDSSIWVVDFEEIAKAFLSSRIPAVFDYGTEKQLKTYTSVIRNFLNYLLHHDVCPEYSEQINSARAICDLAEKELWQVRQASWALPGDFNIACSTLFGGYYQGLYAGDQEWAKGMELTIGMSDQDAWRTFKIGLAAAGEDQAQRFADLAKRSDNKVIKSRAVGLEVTKIIYADEETRQFYNDQVHDQRVLGKICAREWKCPAVPDDDLTEEEKASAPLKPEEFEFWVEEDVLEVCFVGLKMEATFRDLNCGVQYFDQVIAVYCSFYTFLANEWMIGWKNPELLADGRQEMDAEADEGDDGLD